jgi:ribosomal protein L37AE/L43A
MDKLGVDVDESQTKEASGEPKTTCPKCGAALVHRALTNVPQCPKCGTQPFEGPDGTS